MKDYIINQESRLILEEMTKKGVYLYHYSFVFPHQVLNKSKIYKANPDPTFAHDRADAWAVEVWSNLERPFDVHNRYGAPAWLTPFHGKMPESAAAMFEDIRAGRLKCDLRKEDDIDTLLRSNKYKAKRYMAEWLFDIYRKLGDSPRGYWFSRAVFIWLNNGTLSLCRAISRKLGRKYLGARDR